MRMKAGILLMLASLAVFIIGFTMGGLNYVVTILQVIGGVNKGKSIRPGQLQSHDP